ncbi:MAG: hypothetical protein H7A49_03010 [Akkermansiaceae bacterium]|nr:hypothetical protein [Akkermansiaceae bacterium]
MRRLPVIGAVLWAAGLVPASAQTDGSPPDLSSGRVTISYQELRALWEAGRRSRGEGAPEKPAPPPLSHCWNLAEGTLSFDEDGGGGVLDWKWSGRVLADGWQEVDLFDGTVSLEEADAGGAPVVWKDGFRVLTEEAGPLDVTVRCATPGWKELAAGGVLRVRPAAAAVKRLVVTGVPDGYEARWGGGEVIRSGDGFLLPPGDEELTLELKPPHVEAPLVASEWRVENRVLVRPGEGRLEYLARVTAQADGGSGVEMELEFPGNAVGVTVDGEDLASSETRRTADGGRRLLVRWKTRDVLDRELMVTYAVPLSPLATRWELRAPHVEDGAKSLFAVVPGEGMELGGEPLHAVPPQRLGGWMRAALGGQTFVTAESGAELDLDVRWLPVVESAEAVVSASKATQQVVEDGSMRTSVSWLIRHSSAMPWRVEMPADIELLSCTVAGKAVKPVSRESGVFEIALPAPNDAKSGSTVELTYTGRIDALDPVGGRVALELPRTSLFIERIEWSVALPPRCEVIAVEGNATVSKPASAGVVELRKDLCRGEKPAAGFFYQIGSPLR